MGNEGGVPLSNIQVIEQKIVDFNGAKLIAAKLSDGKIYAGIKWVCEGIGLTRDQAKNERKKIQEDLVLKQGGRNLTLPTNGGLQQVSCIDLDFLPLWLAKISITPSMQKESPWTVQRLVDFQLRAKDVLAEAFIKKPKTQAELIAMIAQHNVEQERRLSQVESRLAETEIKHENIVEILSLNPTEWRKKVNTMLNRIAHSRGGFQEFQNIRNESYLLLEERAKCNLSTRLTNKQRKMALEGVGKSKIDKVNKMDVISDDSRLTEIYLAIIKEMAIRYQVNIENI